MEKMQRRVAQDAHRYFMTGVSMITSTGSEGQNVMAAEWTMQISYEPMLIAVFIHDGSSTLENIKETKEFGVNVASQEQTTAVSIAGGYSRKEIDKLALRGFFQLLKPIKIKPPLIAGCIVNAECKLLTTKKIGDHIMIVGKVVSIKYNKTKKPLVYHQNRYFRIGPMMEPMRQEIKASKKIFDLFSNDTERKFILRCVGAMIQSRNKVLVNQVSYNSCPTIPYDVPHRGQNQKKTLETHLKKMKLDVVLRQDPSLKRLILKKGKKAQRINFVLFSGRLKNKPSTFRWKSVKKDTFLQALVK